MYTLLTQLNRKNGPKLQRHVECIFSNLIAVFIRNMNAIIQRFNF